MKTSNKLLIALAALFFIVPLTAMIYDSKNYVDAKTYKAENEKPKKFDEELKGFSTQTLSAFNAIKIADGKGLRFNVTVINDTKSGVKVNDRYKGVLTFSVDANGTLVISVLKKPEESNYVNVLVYAPSITKVTIADANGLDLPGTFDSLAINAKNMGDLRMGDDNTINHLTINGDNIGDLSFWSANISNLTLSLNNTSFKSNGSDFKNLVINTTGKGDVELEGKDDDKSASIENLNLTTAGKGSVSMKNVTVKNVAGALSDSTTVNMPVMYLKQLMK